MTFELSHTVVSTLDYSKVKVLTAGGYFTEGFVIKLLFNDRVVVNISMCKAIQLLVLQASRIQRNSLLLLYSVSTHFSQLNLKYKCV